VERASSFAYPVTIRVHIHLGDYAIEGANVLESTTTKPKGASTNKSAQTIVPLAITMPLDILVIVVWPAMATKNPQRIVQAILKPTEQRIVSWAIITLIMKATVLMSQLRLYVETCH
jgi:hypothetical protein